MSYGLLWYLELQVFVKFSVAHWRDIVTAKQMCSGSYPAYKHFGLYWYEQNFQMYYLKPVGALQAQGTAFSSGLWSIHFPSLVVV